MKAKINMIFRGKPRKKSETGMEAVFSAYAVIIWNLLLILDIMHVVPKSDLGLGIPQNGVLGCRYHHALMDNGNKGLHGEMQDMLEDYMCEMYPGWTRESVRYHKYSF